MHVQCCSFVYTVPIRFLIFPLLSSSSWLLILPAICGVPCNLRWENRDFHSDTHADVTYWYKCATRSALVGWFSIVSLAANLNSKNNVCKQWCLQKSVYEEIFFECSNIWLESSYNHMLYIFQLEEKLLQFHLGNLEFSCAAPLNKVSSLSWDQNEAFPQFSGDHTLLQNGFGVLLKNLAQGLDITFNCEVCGFVTFPVSLQRLFVFVFRFY